MRAGQIQRNPPGISVWNKFSLPGAAVRYYFTAVILNTFYRPPLNVITGCLPEAGKRYRPGELKGYDAQ
ncbi:hypothetical protein DCCM_4580 [Desulfocucumis palustris]|uniref:Uncharacterized protein n=1 Tax=Desulfocucumis palustris TaxID=1898651 RepID=A0A2L2XH43_9FIRM|nr:hypothetical protein DCCM_4580 [Desulfocucumis palustris]